MWEILKQMLSKLACMHDWKLEKAIRWYNDDNEPVAYTHIYICKKCGKFKKIEN